MKYLDKDEKKLLDSYKKGKWKPIKKKDMEKYVKATKESLSKNKRTYIRP